MPETVRPQPESASLIDQAFERQIKNSEKRTELNVVEASTEEARVHARKLRVKIEGLLGIPLKEENETKEAFSARLKAMQKAKDEIMVANGEKRSSMTDIAPFHNEYLVPDDSGSRHTRVSLIRQPTDFGVHDNRGLDSTRNRFMVVISDLQLVMVIDEHTDQAEIFPSPLDSSQRSTRRSFAMEDYRPFEVLLDMLTQPGVMKKELSRPTVVR